MVFLLSFLSFSLFSLLSTSHAVPLERDLRLSHNTIHNLDNDNDFSSCEFTIQRSEKHPGVLSPRHNYNLCPILSPHVWRRTAVQSAENGKAAVTDDGQMSLRVDGSEVESVCSTLGCSTSMHDSKTSVSEELLVGTTTGGWPKEARIESMTEATLTANIAENPSTPPILTLRLKTAGGCANALIYLDCDMTGSEDAKSILEPIPSKGNAIPSFHWKTQHACPTTDMIIAPHVSREAHHAGSVNILEEKRDESSDSDEVPDDNLLDLPPHTELRRSIVVTLVLLASSIILIIYLYISPPPRLQSFISVYVRPTTGLVINTLLKPLPNFRVGESRLVRWAQEDMGVLDDEEDQMVNGSVFSTDDFEFDEGIPLKPSLWKQSTRGHANYGSLSVSGW